MLKHTEDRGGEREKEAMGRSHHDCQVLNAAKGQGYTKVTLR